MMERRRCQRLQPPYAMIAMVRGAERARVLDLSPHGILLETALPFGLWKTCPVTLLLTTGELHLRCVVRSCRTAIDEQRSSLVFHAGLELVTLSVQQREVLEQVLVEYCLMEVAGRYESVAIGKTS